MRANFFYSNKPSCLIRKFHQPSSLIFSQLFFILCFGCDSVNKHTVEITTAILHPASSGSIPETNKEDVRQPLTQASGWIEPDPYPLRVPSLYDGVVEEVFVLEGELISAGQKLVSLVDEDAELSVQLAKQEVLAQKSKETEFKSLLSVQRFSLSKAKQESQKAQSLFNEQLDYLTRLESLPQGSVPNFDLNQSRYKRDSAKFDTEVFLYKEKIIEEQIELLTKKLLSQKHRTKIAELQHEKAILDLNRTKIYSPFAGRILKLFAQPGKRLMQNMDRPDASTVVSLYSENKLQARIDVPLAELSKLFIGQDVEISCSMLPERKFRGTLTRILGQADLQRNTLQVKVQILNPDSQLRPEMLCRAKFFSNKINSGNGNLMKPKILGVFVPKSLQKNQEASQDTLWVIGQNGKSAELRTVEFGDETINQYIQVLTGLKAGDQIILNPPSDLQTGDAVKISAVK